MSSFSVFNQKMVVKQFLIRFVYALKGIKASAKEQRNLKVHCGIATVTIAAGLYYEISSIEWFFLLAAMGLVLSLEMINTSIETFVDFVTIEHNPQGSKIKDIASGAVFVATVISMIVSVLVFKKYCRGTGSSDDLANALRSVMDYL